MNQKHFTKVTFVIETDELVEARLIAEGVRKLLQESDTEYPKPDWVSADRISAMHLRPSVVYYLDKDSHATSEL